MAGERPAATLGELRAEIDRIDEAMHRLLMERGAIIDRLIATKGTAESGSAFRPDREASMLRALAERHRGRLPVDAIEGIWRVIISTFTHVQAPFAVHGDLAGGAAAMRDVARYHFGFTVPYREHADAASVVAAVAASRGDLGLVPLGARTGGEAWWSALEGAGAPKVIARLPFVERPDHPASHPVLVIASAAAEPGPDGAAVYAASGTGPAPALGSSREGADILASAAVAGDFSALVTAPLEQPAEAVRAALGVSRLTPIGTAPARFALRAKAD